MENEVNELLPKEELIARFASIEQISKEDATQLIGGETSAEIMRNITNYNVQKLRNQFSRLNRKQRRALKKKMGTEKYNAYLAEHEAALITETAEKLNQIDLIQKLRNLNEKKEQENNDEPSEDN